MTEWNAAEYARQSGLQEAMPEEVLVLLDLNLRPLPRADPLLC
jgi:hypothetical protein